MNNIKIGITEAGDAAIDYSWLHKLDACNGVILITKNLADKLISEIIKHQEKIILHATCTGMGGTPIEPNVPIYTKQLAQVQKLIDAGFPVERITIRIDPIVPTEKGLKTAQKVIDASPIKRFRVSALDTYPHVRERFVAAGVPLPYGNSFQPSAYQFAAMREWLASQNPEYVFETCAEPLLKDAPNVRASGCISHVDLEKFGIHDYDNFVKGRQRRDCLCLSCKTELLNNRHRCPHGCLYCYWKDY